MWLLSTSYVRYSRNNWNLCVTMLQAVEAAVKVVEHVWVAVESNTKTCEEAESVLANVVALEDLDLRPLILWTNLRRDR